MNFDRSKMKKSKDRVVDFLGAVIPLRAREAADAPSKEADLSDVIPDLSNVVPIASRRRIGPDKRIPDVTIEDGRPAPIAVLPDRKRQIALLVGASFAVHTALFAVFNRPPPPLASVGEVSVSVELVLGTNRAAGRSNRPSESEVSSAAAAKKNEPLAEQAEAPKKSVDEKQPNAAPAPKETMTAAVTPEPAELPVPPKDPVDHAASTPVEQKTKPTEQKPDPAPVRKRANESEDGKSDRRRVTPASTPSVASNSIGLGRSDASTNYRGIVSAHLARYKQFPADARARGDQGTASVTFSLDGGGRVTSVRLARASGVASIDQETQAMVRRASPFPAPPDGRGASFTVPVSFYLR